MVECNNCGYVPLNSNNLCAECGGSDFTFIFFPSGRRGWEGGGIPDVWGWEG